GRGGSAARACRSRAGGGHPRRGPGGSLLTADFDELGGLKARAPVVISGVKVGQVRSIGLGDDYRAHVTLDLDPSLKLPKDTSASIVTAGLLGDRYISLQLGGEQDELQSRDAIAFTESALLLGRRRGKLVHSTDTGGDAGKSE